MKQQTVKLIFFDSPIFQQKVSFTAIFVQTVNLFRRNETFALLYLIRDIDLEIFQFGRQTFMCICSQEKSRKNLVKH